MLNNLESTIHQIIVNTSATMAKQIATAVRQALAAEIIGSTAAAPARRGPGRPKKVVAAAKPQKRTKLKRRSSKRVARDDAAILGAIKAKPGMRALDLKTTIKMPSQNIASGLKHLREAGKIKMKGVKSAAKYSAA